MVAPVEGSVVVPAPTVERAAVEASSSPASVGLATALGRLTLDRHVELDGHTIRVGGEHLRDAEVGPRRHLVGMSGLGERGHEPIDVRGVECNVVERTGRRDLGPLGDDVHMHDRAVVHVNVVAERAEIPSTGAFNHVAFDATDVDGLVTSLAEAGHPHEVSTRPDLGIAQVLTTDPNGVAVELNVPIEG